MKIDYIIHGGSSFLGKNLILYLQSKPNKNCLIIGREKSVIPKSHFKILRYKNSISELDLETFDLENSIFLEFSWFGVFGTERNNIDQVKVNVELISNSIEFSKKHKVKHWVGIGSQAEYGNLNKEIFESDDCTPTTMYGQSKLLCCNLAKFLRIL